MAPNQFEDVYFDANSFSAPGQTVTVNVNGSVPNGAEPRTRDLSWLTTLYEPTLAGIEELNVYGSLNLVPGMNVTHSADWNFKANDPGHKVNTAGQVLNGVNFLSTATGSGAWTLKNHVSVTGDVNLEKGVLDTNGKDITAQNVNIRTTAARDLSLGDSVVTVVDGGWNVEEPSTLTFDAGTSNIRVTGNSASDFDGAGQTYNDVTFDTGGALSSALTGENTFNTLRVEGGVTLSLEPGVQTTTQLEIVGSCLNPVAINSTVSGTAATFLQASGTVEATSATLQDNTADGGASFSALQSHDLGNVTGWTVAAYTNLTVSVATTDPTAAGNDGTADATPAGGLPPYTYRWSTGETASMISGLIPGPYSVEVTDDGGCTTVENFTINGGAGSDTTPPEITANVVGTLGDNDWYVSDVNVSWTVTDPESTVSSTTGCGPTTISADTTGTLLTCEATSDGGTTSVDVTIKRDATPPTATASALPAPNGNGWNNTDVTVSYLGSDATSGLNSCDAADVLSGEGAGQSASGTCTDNAGNTSALATASDIDIDKTAPTASASALPAPNGLGWNNTDVTVSFSGTDALSGLDACSADSVLTTDGTGQSASGTCTDNAGNTSTLATASGIDIDKTAPTASAGASPPANANGWNNTDVTVSFSGTDALSGLDACSADAVLTTEGAGQSASGSCTDNAGNTSALATASGIDIDKTAPTASASASPPANANGWNNTDVTVSFSGTDALSGLDVCSADSVLTTEGAGQSASGSCTDNAGNTSALATASDIDIDKTAPTASASASPAANANGWNNTDVTVEFSGTDSLSGLDACSADSVLTTDGAGQSASGTCTDNAGNTSALATASGIDIDKTAPTASASALPAPNANGWNNSDVTVTYAGTDATSGIDSCDIPDVLGGEGAGQSVSGTCTDLAGNVSAAASVSGINIDKTAPAAVFGGPYDVDEGSSVSLSGNGSSDALSGVDTTDWAVDGDSLYDDGDPANFDGIDGPSTAPVSLRVVDLAGNEAFANGDVTVDNVAPTIDSLTGPMVPINIITQTLVSVEVNFSDVGTLDTHDVSWNWGDGSITDTQSSAVSPASESHTYAAAGVYPVTVTVDDGDGGVTVDTYEFIVIYDTVAGFVTGVGRIQSPTSACSDALCTTTGTVSARFHFNSEYKKGATIPEGDTNFHFEVGAFEFESTSYDWLIIAGLDKAKYKGEGTINGGGNYGFMVTAQDLSGGPSHLTDTFRIKIWNKNAGDGVVYDNKMGESEDSYSGTDITTGQILVQKKGKKK